MALRIAAAVPGRAARRMRPPWLALVCAVFLFTTPALAQGSLESRVKAAFLFNFTKFVDWPPESFASASAPLDICVFGSDPFGPVLDATVQGKSVNNHPLTVRRVSQATEMGNCKILYVSTPDTARQRELMDALRGQAVLTVGDTPGFISAGGMIRFLIVDGKVRFEVNRHAADQAHLTLSSKLLGVAHAVVNGPGG